jgi:hypothetical protein
MADKNSSSSLLEAIKNKLNKFDKKPTASVDSNSGGAIGNIANYFTADISTKNINEKVLDKTSMNIDLKSTNLDNKISSNTQSTAPENLDNELDLDDESPDIKKLSTQVAIESKIKEIAKEISSEVSTEDFEDGIDEQDSKAQETTQNNQAKSEENIDPIELELQKLEQEILIKKQQQKPIEPPINNNSVEDKQLKDYLDSSFKKDLDIIDNKIATDNNNSNNLDNLAKKKLPEVALAKPVEAIKENNNLSNSLNENDILSSLASLDDAKSNSENILTSSDNSANIADNISLPTNNENAIASKSDETIQPIVKDTTNQDSQNKSSGMTFNFLNNPSLPFSPARDFLAKMESQNNNLATSQNPVPSLPQTPLPTQLEPEVQPQIISPTQLEPEVQPQSAPLPSLSQTPLPTQLEPEFQPQIISPTQLEPELQPQNFSQDKLQLSKNIDQKIFEEKKSDEYKKTAVDYSDISIKTDSIAISSNVSSSINLNIAENPDGKLSPKFDVKDDQLFSSKNINYPIKDNQYYSSNSINFSPNDMTNYNDNSIYKIATENNSGKNLEKNLNQSLAGSSNVSANYQSEITEKINHNLINEETVFQANESIRRLIDAKQMIKNVGNFAQNEILNKIAITLMEPKLEKWLNENLPQMVEEIVRQEIDKIIPKE